MAGIGDIVSVGQNVTRALGQIASALRNANTGFTTSSVVAAGTTQATATLLASPIVLVTSVPSGTGVQLPVAGGNYRQFIANRGANTLNVYPPSGAKIEGFAANAPLTVAAGSDITFYCFGATQWYT